MKISIVIIGFGISTLCFLLYLYDNNLINNFSKILVLEKERSPCLNSLNYINVNSNSCLHTLISMFSNEIFKDIINNVKNKYDLNKFINLSDYNKIISEISNRFINHINKYIDIKFNYEVKDIKLQNGIYIINNLIKVEKIIMASGANHDLNYFKYLDINNILKSNYKKILIPNEIYNNSNISFLNKKNIAIIGSSHSTMTIIDMILKHKINYQKITIFFRNKIKVFYKDKKDCLKNNDTFNSNDICLETGFINRFDGLRENSKEIFLNLNKYSNIELKKLDKNESFKNYDYIFPCWGYYKNLPLIDNKLSYDIDSNLNFELLLNKKLYKNIFLLGINSNPKIEITQKSFKKSLDGIWIYFNIISKQLYKKILL
jgi:hypothetical protein